VIDKIALVIILCPTIGFYNLVMFRMNTITVVGLALIFLGGIGAILLTIGQSISTTKDKNEILQNTKDENIKLKDDIIELRSERQELNMQLAQNDSILQQKNDLIIKLNQKLADKSDYIHDYLTSKGGYPIVYLRKLIPTTDQDIYGFFVVKVVSKYPIYNLEITAYDYDLLSKGLTENPFMDVPVISRSEYNNSLLFHHKVEELSPPQTRTIEKRIKLGVARYYIKLHTRSNVHIQRIATAYYDGLIYYGAQLFDINDKLIEQEFSENIPKAAAAELKKKLNTIPLSLSFTVSE
jgi:hypothetical protein